jgi:hypothetical protein
LLRLAQDLFFVSFFERILATNVTLGTTAADALATSSGCVVHLIDAQPDSLNPGDWQVPTFVGYSPWSGPFTQLTDLRPNAAYAVIDPAFWIPDDFFVPTYFGVVLSGLGIAVGQIVDQNEQPIGPTPGKLKFKIYLAIQTFVVINP